METRLKALVALILLAIPAQGMNQNVAPSNILPNGCKKCYFFGVELAYTSDETNPEYKKFLDKTAYILSIYPFLNPDQTIPTCIHPFLSPDKTATCIKKAIYCYLKLNEATQLEWLVTYIIKNPYKIARKPLNISFSVDEIQKIFTWVLTKKIAIYSTA
jgi:hypothetical protein